jgi:hypothetical protein
MAQQLTESVIYGVLVTLGTIFYVWFLRWLYVNGWWRPFIFILIDIGWQRLKFYVAWLRFSRRYDKLHGFLDLAERTRRKPVSGLLKSDKDKES